MSELKIRAPKRQWEWKIMSKMWDIKPIYLERHGDFSVTALVTMLWGSQNNGWEWEIHFKNNESKWNIFHHWASSPTQIDKFWDTADQRQKSGFTIKIHGTDFQATDRTKSSNVCTFFSFCEWRNNSWNTYPPLTLFAQFLRLCRQNIVLNCASAVQILFTLGITD